MLNFRGIALRRGTRLLFSDTSFTIHKGQKAGFTGANGSGKSSLFALIRGELQADEGEFSLPPGLALAHVAQEMPAVSTFAIDYVMDGDQELRQLQSQLAIAEQAHDGIKQAELHLALENIGGYSAQSKSRPLDGRIGLYPRNRKISRSILFPAVGGCV